MNAKDKALEIIESFYNTDLQNFLGAKEAMDEAKQCAIIHVKGTIDCLDRLDFSLEIDNEVKYWQQVLNELNKM